MCFMLKNDVIFKAVYGTDAEENRQALMGMLNLILGRKENPITSIVYKNPFNIRQINIQKESVLDIKAETDRGELLDVEMQLLYDEEFVPRNLYYHSGMITQSLAAGEPYGRMKRTISIYLLDYIWFRDNRAYHNCFQLYERDSGLLLTDLWEMHYIELPKVNPGQKKRPAELSDAERYLEYLRYAGEAKGNTYLEGLKRDGGKEIQMTEVILQKVTEEELLREQAIARDKFLHRQASVERQLREAKASKEELKKVKEEIAKSKDALQHAEEENRQAAVRQAKLIKLLLSRGMTVDEIAAATDVSKDEIECSIAE